jgi:hypothetical protein
MRVKSLSPIQTVTGVTSIIISTETMESDGTTLKAKLLIFYFINKCMYKKVRWAFVRACVCVFGFVVGIESDDSWEILGSLGKLIKECL